MDASRCDLKHKLIQSINPYLLLILFFMLLSDRVLAGDPDPCDSFQKQVWISVDQDGQSIETLSLEERVPFAFICIHQIRTELERKFSELEYLEQDSIQASQLESKANKAQVNKQISELELRLSSVEEDLRVASQRMQKTVAAKRYCDFEQLAIERQIINIRNYFNIPDYDRLYVQHNDYERYFFKLSLGYEYTSVSGILEENAPRVALLIHEHFGRRPYHDEYGFKFYGIELFGNLTLSGATEQKSSVTPGSDEGQSNRTLGIDVALFSALERSKIRPDLSLHNGPLVLIGAKQTDESTKIRMRTYAGIRSAVSPEHYLDMLFGRSPGLESTRLEIRGQLPVVNLGGDTRLFVGAVANMGIKNKQADENDILTIYMSWNIDFLDMFTPGGS